MGLDGFGWVWIGMDRYWMISMDGLRWIWVALDRFGWILSISTDHIIDNLCRLGNDSLMANE